MKEELGPGDARVRGRRTRFDGEEVVDFGRVDVGDGGGGDGAPKVAGGRVYEADGEGGKEKFELGMGVRSSSVDGSSSVGGRARASSS